MLKDSSGQPHPLFEASGRETLWTLVVAYVVRNAYIDLEVWSGLLQQVDEVHAMQEKYIKDISPDKDLPKEYLRALLRFNFYLLQASQRQLALLWDCVAVSPPLRRYFVREVAKSPTSTMSKILGSDAKVDKIEECELLWLLKTLTDNGVALHALRLTSVVDELESLIQAKPDAHAMLSAYIAPVSFDLSVISEGMRQLNLYQPWARTFEQSLAEMEGAFEKDFAKVRQLRNQLLGDLDGPHQSQLACMGSPEDSKFHYPVDMRRTRINVEAMRTAEQNLDSFWAVVDEEMRERVGTGLDGSAVWRLLSQPRVMQRTAEWAEPAKASSTKTVEDITKPLSELYFDLEHRTERTVDRSRVPCISGKKQKTRGVAKQSNGTIKESSAASSAQPDDEPIFAIGSRALKVFRTMFYTPTTSDTPGEILWFDFLHAMASVGFIVEKLYGSVWQFQPAGLHVERSIQFHEPHPSGKIPYCQARRHGRRLKRAYGWVGSTFVLREKQQKD